MEEYDPPLAWHWNRLTCAAIHQAQLPPTLAARALAMVHTAMYDAWSNYIDGPCISTTTGDRLQQRPEDLTTQNRELAFSRAAWAILEALFGDVLATEAFSEKLDILPKAILASIKECRASDHSLDLTQPQGVGQLSAQLVINNRLSDPYSGDGYNDTGSYQPVNPAEPERAKDVARWQAQSYDGERTQVFLHPDWWLVRPFALTCVGQFRPPPPAGNDACGLNDDIEKIIDISAKLTDQQKLTAEYWAGMYEDRFDDWFKSCGGQNSNYWAVAPVQCCRIGRQLAASNNFRNSNVIKLYFALSNALLDTSIAVWDAKVFYDHARPESVIHHLKDDEEFNAWGGACRGTVTMQGEGWRPYLLRTPAYAEYPSAHSAFYQALAEIIQSFCNQNDYQTCIEFEARSSKIESDCTPAEAIELSWNSIIATAESAGSSRRFAGVNFPESERQGCKLGEKVADQVWCRAISFFKGCTDN